MKVRAEASEVDILSTGLLVTGCVESMVEGVEGFDLVEKACCERDPCFRIEIETRCAPDLVQHEGVAAQLDAYARCATGDQLPGSFVDADAAQVAEVCALYSVRWLHLGVPPALDASHEQ